METLGVFFFLISPICCLQLDQVERKEFLEWTNQHNKFYETDTDLEGAFANYRTTKKTTIKHNENFQKGIVSFQQKLNKFADLSPKAAKARIFGNAHVASRFGGGTVTFIAPGSLPPAPPSWDWQALGMMTPVKDQGFFCNCCWAFSAIAVLEAHFFIKLGRSVIMSEQNLIDCARNNITGNWGCDGGSQGSAFKYVEINGIESSSTYPYEENFRHAGIYRCRFNSSRSVGKIKGYYRIRPNNEDLVAEVVATLGPVSFAFDGSRPSFLYYSNGIYDDPECLSGLHHSAIIIGFGTYIDEVGNATKFWLCKNSWSTDWGENGYFRMVRGKNMCGMTNFLSLPMVV